MKLSDDAQLFERTECQKTLPKDSFIAVVPDATDCFDVYQKGWKMNGVYGVRMEGGVYRPILCEMEIHGGGWTTMQKRFDGSIDFAQTWYGYKNGFGDLRSEFW